MMTRREKADFCEWMAALFSPPEPAMIEEFRAAGRSFPGKEFPLPGDYPAMEREYRRLFAGAAGRAVSLVESTYKPWTGDEECRLSFAREKGLLMGDSAVHMAAVFRQAGVEVPGEFRACPDHLVLELEFLSALYAAAGEPEAGQFIRDHLDWIPELKKSLAGVRAHPFYSAAAERLNSFLEGEKRLEITANGEKSVH